MSDEEPKSFGKRADVFNKAFNLTIESSLHPLIDEEIFDSLFGHIFKDKSDGMNIMAKFYEACKVSIEVK